jgi:sugar/nucleoside kinase (ribokinase family)
MGARTSIITQGDRGAVLVAEGLKLRSGSFSVPFVDGTGGGDAFAAGYIAGLLRGWGAEECLRIASAVGASCVRARRRGVHARRVRCLPEGAHAASGAGVRSPRRCRGRVGSAGRG